MPGMSRVTNPLVTECVAFGRNPLPQWAASWKCIGPPINAISGLRITINQIREQARTELCEGSIKDKSKFTYMQDDDVTVPPFVIRKLLHAMATCGPEVAAIGGIYCTKTEPPMPAVFRKRGEGPCYDWKLNEVFEVEVAPLGMLLIRNEALQNISKPWFVDVEDVDVARQFGLIEELEHPDNVKFTDDAFFCHRLRQAGYKVMAHGGVLGVHWHSTTGQAFLLPSDTYPIKTELIRRWGVVDCGDEFEQWKRLRAVYQDVYGPVDLIPGFVEFVPEVNSMEGVVK